MRTSQKTMSKGSRRTASFAAATLAATEGECPILRTTWPMESAMRGSSSTIRILAMLPKGRNGL